MYTFLMLVFWFKKHYIYEVPEPFSLADFGTGYKGEEKDCFPLYDISVYMCVKQNRNDILLIILAMFLSNCIQYLVVCAY